MTKIELIFTHLLLDFYYYLIIFIIVYFIYKMDQRGRKAIRESNQKKLNLLIDDKNSPKQTATKKDAFEKLKKLSELKNLGIISDEEYETQRKKFLNEM